MTPAPKRRWFRFSLRTLFVVVTVAAVWLGWQVSIVRQRQAIKKWATDNGGWAAAVGSYVAGAYLLTRDPEVSAWRRWLGDEPIVELGLPLNATQAEVDRAKAAFPEATVLTGPYN